MKTYRFTAFEKSGKTLFDEAWEFADDVTAKTQGQQQVEEKGLADQTHRLVNSAGKLILFHS
ncbi:YhzD family protein [Viridibacillus sp. NPDC093762]|uniref:YhzD family protein n=1 Tax=Viridibacillus sp. NPDC093762 TaxID=3390720 RepID=UPI003CFCB5B5